MRHRFRIRCVGPAGEGTGIALHAGLFHRNDARNRQRRIADFRQHVAAGTRIYVTSLPGSEFGDIVEIGRRLSAEGMVAVPHFTARGNTCLQMLEERLDRVTSEAGVRDTLFDKKTARWAEKEIAKRLAKPKKATDGQ